MEAAPLSKVYDAARGRWKGILMGLGMLDSKQLSGKSCACPMCGGTDRFQFDDKEGNGSYFCRQCGNGLGVDLVSKIKGLSYAEACKLIEAQAGVSKFEAPRAARNDDRAKRDMAALWSKAQGLDGRDAASRYLRTRGIEAGIQTTSLRVLEALTYSECGEPNSEWPCMLAKFAAPDGQSSTLHRTYLTTDGKKAPVSKPRKLMAGPVPHGGAVRLGLPEKVMGVAEGIETALAAAQLHDVPVWSTLSAGNLIKFEPPPECLHLLIFTDSDPTWTGQYASYALAHRLATDKKRDITAEVCHTKFRDDGESDDWNNFLLDCA